MINTRKAELLAPAGSFDSLKAAVAAGADAIYMGGSRFGARAYAQNAAGEEMVEAIRYAHLHGCRLYMTVNTLFKEKELDELCDYMKPYYEAGLDGVIVQDLGALQVMKRTFPGMELHASTQMTVTSVYSAKMLKEMGCCRVVPARELSLEEISHIYKETGMDIVSVTDILNPSFSCTGVTDEKSYFVFCKVDGNIQECDFPDEDIKAGLYTKEEVRKLLETEVFSARTQAVCYLWSRG